jgi:hypothetical protein
MTARGRKKSARPARPIRTRRDYERAKALVGNLTGDAALDSTAELRLKSLLSELDRYDEPADDLEDPFADDSGYAGPRRRWSDDAPDGENP